MDRCANCGSPLLALVAHDALDFMAEFSPNGDSWVQRERRILLEEDSTSYDFQNLQDDIRAHGIREPVVVGLDRTVKDGHHRVLAARNTHQPIPYHLEGASHEAVLAEAFNGLDDRVRSALRLWDERGFVRRLPRGVFT